MPETKLAITRINRLNPLRLGKDGYVLRIEKAIEETDTWDRANAHCGPEKKSGNGHGPRYIAFHNRAYRDRC